MTTSLSSSLANLLPRMSTISLPPRVEGDIYGDIEIVTYGIQFSSLYEQQQQQTVGGGGGQNNRLAPTTPSSASSSSDTNTVTNNSSPANLLTMYTVRVRWWGQDPNLSNSSNNTNFPNTFVHTTSIPSSSPLSVYVNQAQQRCNRFVASSVPSTDTIDKDDDLNGNMTNRIYYPLCTDSKNMATYFRDMSHLLLEIYPSSSSVCIGTCTILLKDTLGHEQASLSGVVPIISTNPISRTDNTSSSSTENSTNNTNHHRIGSLVYSLILRYGKESVILSRNPTLLQPKPISSQTSSVPPLLAITENTTNPSTESALVMNITGNIEEGDTTIPPSIRKNDNPSIPFASWEAQVTSLKLRSEAISNDRERDIQQGIPVQDHRNEVQIPVRPSTTMLISTMNNNHTEIPVPSMMITSSTVDMNVSYPMVVDPLDPNAVSTLSSSSSVSSSSSGDVSSVLLMHQPLRVPSPMVSTSVKNTGTNNTTTTSSSSLVDGLHTSFEVAEVITNYDVHNVLPTVAEKTQVQQQLINTKNGIKTTKASSPTNGTTSTPSNSSPNPKGVPNNTNTTVSSVPNSPASPSSPSIVRRSSPSRLSPSQAGGLVGRALSRSSLNNSSSSPLSTVSANTSPGLIYPSQRRSPSSSSSSSSSLKSIVVNNGTLTSPFSDTAPRPDNVLAINSVSNGSHSNSRAPSRLSTDTDKPKDIWEGTTTLIVPSSSNAVVPPPSDFQSLSTLPLFHNTKENSNSTGTTPDLEISRMLGPVSSSSVVSTASTASVWIKKQSATDQTITATVGNDPTRTTHLASQIASIVQRSSNLLANIDDALNTTSKPVPSVNDRSTSQQDTAIQEVIQHINGPRNPTVSARLRATAVTAANTLWESAALSTQSTNKQNTQLRSSSVTRTVSVPITSTTVTDTLLPSTLPHALRNTLSPSDKLNLAYQEIISTLETFDTDKSFKKDEVTDEDLLRDYLRGIDNGAAIFLGDDKENNENIQSKGTLKRQELVSILRSTAGLPTDPLQTLIQEASSDYQKLQKIIDTAESVLRIPALVHLGENLYNLSSRIQGITTSVTVGFIHPAAMIAIAHELSGKFGGIALLTVEDSRMRAATLGENNSPISQQTPPNKGHSPGSTVSVSTSSPPGGGGGGTSTTINGSSPGTVPNGSETTPNDVPPTVVQQRSPRVLPKATLQTLHDWCMNCRFTIEYTLPPSLSKTDNTNTSNGNVPTAVTISVTANPEPTKLDVVQRLTKGTGILNTNSSNINTISTNNNPVLHSLSPPGVVSSSLLKKTDTTGGNKGPGGRASPNGGEKSMQTPPPKGTKPSVSSSSALKSPMVIPPSPSTGNTPNPQAMVASETAALLLASSITASGTASTSNSMPNMPGGSSNDWDPAIVVPLPLAHSRYQPIQFDNNGLSGWLGSSSSSSTDTGNNNTNLTENGYITINLYLDAVNNGTSSSSSSSSSSGTTTVPNTGTGIHLSKGVYVPTGVSATGGTVTDENTNPSSSSSSSSSSSLHSSLPQRILLGTGKVPLRQLLLSDNYIQETTIDIVHTRRSTSIGTNNFLNTGGNSTNTANPLAISSILNTLSPLSHGPLSTMEKPETVESRRQTFLANLKLDSEARNRVDRAIRARAAFVEGNGTQTGLISTSVNENSFGGGSGKGQKPITLIQEIVARLRMRIELHVNPDVSSKGGIQQQPVSYIDTLRSITSSSSSSLPNMNTIGTVTVLSGNKADQYNQRTTTADTLSENTNVWYSSNETPSQLYADTQRSTLSTVVKRFSSPLPSLSLSDPLTTELFTILYNLSSLAGHPSKEIKLILNLHNFQMSTVRDTVRGYYESCTSLRTTEEDNISSAQTNTSTEKKERTVPFVVSSFVTIRPPRSLCTIDDTLFKEYRLMKLPAVTTKGLLRKDTSRASTEPSETFAVDSRTFLLQANIALPFRQCTDKHDCETLAVMIVNGNKLAIIVEIYGYIGIYNKGTRKNTLLSTEPLLLGTVNVPLTHLAPALIHTGKSLLGGNGNNSRQYSLPSPVLMGTGTRALKIVHPLAVTETTGTGSTSGSTTTSTNVLPNCGRFEITVSTGSVIQESILFGRMKAATCIQKNWGYYWSTKCLRLRKEAEEIEKLRLLKQQQEQEEAELKLLQQQQQSGKGKGKYGSLSKTSVIKTGNTTNNNGSSGSTNTNNATNGRSKGIVETEDKSKPSTVYSNPTVVPPTILPSLPVNIGSSTETTTITDTAASIVTKPLLQAVAAVRNGSPSPSSKRKDVPVVSTPWDSTVTIPTITGTTTTTVPPNTAETVSNTLPTDVPSVIPVSNDTDLVALQSRLYGVSSSSLAIRHQFHLFLPGTCSTSSATVTGYHIAYTFPRLPVSTSITVDEKVMTSPTHVLWWSARNSPSNSTAIHSISLPTNIPIEHVLFPSRYTTTKEENNGIEFSIYESNSVDMNNDDDNNRSSNNNTLAQRTVTLPSSSSSSSSSSLSTSSETGSTFIGTSRLYRRQIMDVIYQAWKDAQLSSAQYHTPVPLPQWHCTYNLPITYGTTDEHQARIAAEEEEKDNQRYPSSIPLVVTYRAVPINIEELTKTEQKFSKDQEQHLSFDGNSSFRSFADTTVKSSSSSNIETSFHPSGGIDTVNTTVIPPILNSIPYTATTVMVENRHVLATNTEGDGLPTVVPESQQGTDNVTSLPVVLPTVVTPDNIPVPNVNDSIILTDLAGLGSSSTPSVTVNARNNLPVIENDNNGVSMIEVSSSSLNLSVTSTSSSSLASLSLSPLYSPIRTSLLRDAARLNIDVYEITEKIRQQQQTIDITSTLLYQPHLNMQPSTNGTNDNKANTFVWPLLPVSLYSPSQAPIHVPTKSILSYPVSSVIPNDSLAMLLTGPVEESRPAEIVTVPVKKDTNNETMIPSVLPSLPSLPSLTIPATVSKNVSLPVIPTATDKQEEELTTLQSMFRTVPVTVWIDQGRHFQWDRLVASSAVTPTSTINTSHPTGYLYWCYSWPIAPPSTQVITSPVRIPAGTGNRVTASDEEINNTLVWNHQHTFRIPASKSYWKELFQVSSIPPTTKQDHHHRYDETKGLTFKFTLHRYTPSVTSPVSGTDVTNPVTVPIPANTPLQLENVTSFLQQLSVLSSLSSSSSVRTPSSALSSAFTPLLVNPVADPVIGEVEIPLHHLLSMTGTLHGWYPLRILSSSVPSSSSVTEYGQVLINIALTNDEGKELLSYIHQLIYPCLDTHTMVVPNGSTKVNGTFNSKDQSSTLDCTLPAESSVPNIVLDTSLPMISSSLHNSFTLPEVAHIVQDMDKISEHFEPTYTNSNNDYFFRTENTVTDKVVAVPEQAMVMGTSFVNTVIPSEPVIILPSNDNVVNDGELTEEYSADFETIATFSTQVSSPSVSPVPVTLPLPSSSSAVTTTTTRQEKDYDDSVNDEDEDELLQWATLLNSNPTKGTVTGSSTLINHNDNYDDESSKRKLRIENYETEYSHDNNQIPLVLSSESGKESTEDFVTFISSSATINDPVTVTTTTIDPLLPFPSSSTVIPTTIESLPGTLDKSNDEDNYRNGKETDANDEEEETEVTPVYPRGHSVFGDRDSDSELIQASLVTTSSIIPPTDNHTSVPVTNDKDTVTFNEKDMLLLHQLLSTLPSDVSASLTKDIMNQGILHYSRLNRNEGTVDDILGHYVSDHEDNEEGTDTDNEDSSHSTRTETSTVTSSSEGDHGSSPETVPSSSSPSSARVSSPVIRTSEVIHTTLPLLDISQPSPESLNSSTTTTTTVSDNSQSTTIPSSNSSLNETDQTNISITTAEVQAALLHSITDTTTGVTNKTTVTTPVSPSSSTKVIQEVTNWVDMVANVDEWTKDQQQQQHRKKNEDSTNNLPQQTTTNIMNVPIASFPSASLSSSSSSSSFIPVQIPGLGLVYIPIVTPSPSMTTPTIITSDTTTIPSIEPSSLPRSFTIPTVKANEPASYSKLKEHLKLPTVPISLLSSSSSSSGTTASMVPLNTAPTMMHETSTVSPSSSTASSSIIEFSANTVNPRTQSKAIVSNPPSGVLPLSTHRSTSSSSSNTSRSTFSTPSRSTEHFASLLRGAVKNSRGSSLVSSLQSTPVRGSK